MGISICNCNSDNQNMPLPHSNISLLDNKKNKNVFAKNIDDLNHQSNNINDTRKNININIININKDQINSKKYSSNNNNSSCINNNETNKVLDPLNYRKGEIVKEESYAKEGGQEEEEEEEQREDDKESIEKIDSELEKIKSNVIKNFDSKIIEFAEYITEEKLDEIEKSTILKLDENFDKYNFDNNSKNNKYPECFTRPALLFKKDKSIYKGSWNFQWKKEGFGIYFDSNGNKYIGEFKDDKFDGKGRILSVNGDCYDGDFKEGQIEGNGMFISTSGGYNYIGEFKNNKFHGKGKLIFDDNTTYEGAFSKGYMTGEGNLLFRDGSYYKGNFDKNKFNGKGKFYFHDGRKYNGDWKNNNMDGIGKFSWDDDTKYNGEYKNNIREGNGVYSFGANLYDGHWVNGMPHGDGTLLNDGLRIVGIFRYGKMVEMTESKGANREINQKFTMDRSSRDKLDTQSEKNDGKISIFRKFDSVGNSLKDKKREHSKYNKETRSIKFKEPNSVKEKENKKHKKEKSKEKSKVKIKLDN